MKTPTKLLDRQDGPHLAEILNRSLDKLDEIRAAFAEEFDERSSDEANETDEAQEHYRFSDEYGCDLIFLLNRVWASLDLTDLSEGATIILYMAANRILTRLMAERSDTLLSVFSSFLERLDSVRIMSANDGEGNGEESDPAKKRADAPGDRPARKE